MIGMSKGRTLIHLQGLVKKSQVLPSLLVSHRDFTEKNLKAIGDFLEAFTMDTLFVVRSSFLNEDLIAHSFAGVYESALGVPREELSFAIERVFASADSYNENNEVLIQPFLQNVSCSGVLFTRHQKKSVSYVTIELSRGSDTTLITSGKNQSPEVYVYWTGNANASSLPEALLLDEMLSELKFLCDSDTLDIEFAFQPGNSLPILLQVRPIVINSLHDLSKLDNAVEQSLTKLQTWLIPRFQRNPLLVGDSTIYGVMPDWNPAEIIGIRPKPLAFSLYREIITDGMWAYQRHNYGYRNLRSVPLMTDLLGVPYIDVRTSFNSFIPAKLPDSIAEKLVNGYLQKLKQNPALHDKVEFEIVISCLTFSFFERVEELQAFGLTSNEIEEFRQALLEITTSIFDPKTPIWLSDANRIEQLEPRRQRVTESKLTLLEKFYWLLEDCKRYGTLPFGGLARAAFISRQFLDSMVKEEILSKEQRQHILMDAKTITSQILYDLIALDRKDFLKLYGHLRPGTYEISQLSYNEMPWETVFSNETLISKSHSLKKTSDYGQFALDEETINSKLQSIGINTPVCDVIETIKKTIRLREQSKFFFTKNLSLALDTLVLLGKEMGIHRDDLSFLDYNSVRQASTSFSDAQVEFKRIIESNKRNYVNNSHTWLPPLISSPNDILAFGITSSIPNFIGNLKVMASPCDPVQSSLLNGSIAILQNADPGYDWIFSKGIRGLVTAYGGSNSHMAVRASELGITAAIGVGPDKFEELYNASQIIIDPIDEMVSILK